MRITFFFFFSDLSLLVKAYSQAILLETPLLEAEAEMNFSAIRATWTLNPDIL